MNFRLLHPDGGIRRAIESLHQCRQNLRYTKSDIGDFYFTGCGMNLDHVLISFPAFRHRFDGKTLDDSHVFEPLRHEFIKAGQVFSMAAVDSSLLRTGCQNGGNRQLTLLPYALWRFSGPWINTFWMIAQGPKIVNAVQRRFSTQSKVRQKFRILKTRATPVGNAVELVRLIQRPASTRIPHKPVFTR